MLNKHCILNNEKICHDNRNIAPKKGLHHTTFDNEINH